MERLTAVSLLFSSRTTRLSHAVVGRALCVQEADGRWWMYGVNPGGMAAVGDDPDAAHREFRKTFSQVLKDLAAEANTFEDYRRLVTQFFDDTNEGYADEWAAAASRVQSLDVN
jgi:hypothetical protein